MVELLIAVYGGLCYLVFVRFKLIPVNSFTVMTAILGAVVILVSVWGMMAMCHPAATDARIYSPVIPIVPDVRGRVIEVPIKTQQKVKAGEILFRIDPEPYQIEVDRLQAVLAAKNLKVAQLQEEWAIAEAVAREAAASLLVSESKFDRQVRQEVAAAEAKVTQYLERLSFEQHRLERSVDLLEKQAISAQEFERVQASLDQLTATIREAESQRELAKEKLSIADTSVQSAREILKAAKSEASRVRLALDADSDGMNPEVREIMALLDQAQLDLERCVVRAPIDGFVPQLTLRPGQMAVPLPLSPIMAFATDERYLIATFSQHVTGFIKSGQHAEVTFRSRPGRVFPVVVKHMLPMIRAGEIDASGRLIITPPGGLPSHFPVVFEYDDELAQEELPVGSVGTVAVYTEKLHALSMVRKIVLRIKAWEHYLFFLPFGSH